jgi:glycerate 2-kinase
MANIDEKIAGKQARILLQQIYEAAIKAAQLPLLLRKQLRVSDSALVVENQQRRYRLPLTGRLFVVGVGKGVDLTGELWEDLLEDYLTEGILVVRDRLPRRPLRRISIVAAGHPIPDRRGQVATQRCLRLLKKAQRNDKVIFLLMGGASSLLVKPAPGLTLEDKRAVTDHLLKSGMNIGEINCVRKHLSSVKAGGILRAAYPGKVITLAVSDVIGNDPTVIGSAPTFHDPTTFRNAWTLLERYNLLEKIPTRVRRYLLRGVQGMIPETMKPNNRLAAQSPFILLASNRDALVAAKHKAESLGFGVTILTSELSGDTQTRARELCSLLKETHDGRKKYHLPHCLLLGGETTVKVQGKGKGGRNQEFALASAIELMGRSGIYMLSAGSDGSDGPTKAAGAFADGGTISRAHAIGLDPHSFLHNSDSYNFFRPLQDLFSPGPTGTNVLDFKIVLLYPVPQSGSN